MKKIDYKNDERWEQCSDIHKKHGVCPNWFVSILLTQPIPDIDNINVAIETGTYEASTTKFFAEIFNTVYTVEKNTTNSFYTSKNLLELYRETKNKYKNINFYSGDSFTFLKDILPSIKERCVILLDAHNGTDTCVIEELKMIKEFLYDTNSIILIDDCDDIGSGKWPNKEELESLLLDINPKYNIVYTGLGRNILIAY
jgi:hypothetical protein